MEIFKGMWELYCSDDSMLTFITQLAYVALIGILGIKILLCIDPEEVVRTKTFMIGSVAMLFCGWFLYYFSIYVDIGSLWAVILFFICAYGYPLLVYEAVTLIIGIVQSLKTHHFIDGSVVEGYILDPEEKEGKLKLVKNNNALIIDDAGVLCYCKNRDIYTADIPEGVTEIGKEAFYCCNNLTNVKLPKSIVKIGDSAFERCRSLNNISFPKSLEEIGVSAFEKCESLECVTIPKNVKKIGRNAFYGCELVNIVIDSKYIIEKASKSKKYLAKRF